MSPGSACWGPTSQSLEDTTVMVAIFATLLAALLSGWFERARLAALLILCTFALAVGLFLYEVYSPEYGFLMPWIQTELGRGVERAAPHG